MEQFTNYIYAALWLAVALFLVFRGGKLSKWMYLLSLYFFFLAGWYLTDAIIGNLLFSGIYIWVFRGVSLIALLLFLIVYFYNKKRRKEQSDSINDNSK